MVTGKQATLRLVDQSKPIEVFICSQPVDRAFIVQDIETGQRALVLTQSLPPSSDEAPTQT